MRGTDTTPAGASGSAYAAAHGTITVLDAETGEPLVVSARTAVDAAAERGDAGVGGVFSASAAAAALPRLADDTALSAMMHLYIQAQREKLVDAVRAQERLDAERATDMAREPMAWRRQRMAHNHAVLRTREYRALEGSRAEEEKRTLVAARALGLL